MWSKAIILANVLYLSTEATNLSILHRLCNGRQPVGPFDQRRSFLSHLINVETDGLSRTSLNDTA